MLSPALHPSQFHNSCNCAASHLVQKTILFALQAAPLKSEPCRAARPYGKASAIGRQQDGQCARLVALTLPAVSPPLQQQVPAAAQSQPARPNPPPTVELYESLSPRMLPSRLQSLLATGSLCKLVCQCVWELYSSLTLCRLCCTEQRRGERSR